MRRASLAAIVLLAVAVLVGCGGGGGQTGSFGNATVTVPSGVKTIGGELTAILEQFPYQRWYASCVEQRFGAAVGAGEEERLSGLPDTEREAKVNAIIAKVGPACERTSQGRPLVDPNATSAELDLLRAELVPTMSHLAESNGLDKSQSACLTQAFEKLPDRYIVQFGNGDQKTRGSILLTIFKTCAAAG